MIIKTEYDDEELEILNAWEAGFHHRHYKGDVQAVEFISYEATLARFQQEWLAIVKATGAKRS